ncbi:mitogen-activated protein kinase 15 [Phlebotomus argentipes]|uniref:mitogen-activated protein kinase 15 n=1 Tax=Phlebotomus argentipes TaxID=94469 RepID=UPI00289348D0|nr:mitogen-activated protein kinase 15 [Phlebotomus argentipes]
MNRHRRSEIMFPKQKSIDKSNKMSEIDESIAKNFDMKRRLGKGAYGIVWKAVDRTTSKTVAVKKIFDAFRNVTDAQRTFREIMFLRAFRNHPNIIQLLSIHRASNHMDIYLSFEYMESDLHNVIKRGNVLKDPHKRYIMYQLVNAIKYMHSGNVIHRDLKPSNILIDSQCHCKIADFGLARSVAPRQTDSMADEEVGELILTDYVATRWYRAPEILVASKRYTKGIDMWSLGCVLGEMIRGKPLFPGSSTVNQVERIVSALPDVTQADVKAVGGGFGTVLLNSTGAKHGKDIAIDDLLHGGAEDGIALTKMLLILDPAKRLTAKEALSHRYVERFRKSIDEPELTKNVLPPFRDDVQLSVSEYRSKLYELMAGTSSFTLKNGTVANGKPKSRIPKSKVDADKVACKNEMNNYRKFEVRRKSLVRDVGENKLKPIQNVQEKKDQSMVELNTEMNKCRFHRIENSSILDKRHSLDSQQSGNLLARRSAGKNGSTKVAYISLEGHNGSAINRTLPQSRFTGLCRHKSLDESLSPAEGKPSKWSQPLTNGSSLSHEYYDSRLKSLEEKIRKHKLEMSSIMNQSQKMKIEKLDCVPKVNGTVGNLAPVRRRKPTKLDGLPKPTTNRDRQSKLDFYGGGDCYPSGSPKNALNSCGVISTRDSFKFH